MKSLTQFISSERAAIRKDWPQLIMPAMVLLTVVYLLLFRSGDSLAKETYMPLLQKTIAEYPERWELLDLDRLADAVGRHETGNCTLGVGKTHNNATGIKRGGKFVRYATCQDSKEDFKRVWAKYYGRVPTLEDAARWSGSDRYHAWFANVTRFYAE